MRISRDPSASARSRSSGSIIVLLLMLLSLFAVITVGASYSLARLRTGVLSLEQRHAARTWETPAPTAGEGAQPGQTAPGADPATPTPDEPAP